MDATEGRWIFLRDERSDTGTPIAALYSEFLISENFGHEIVQAACDVLKNKPSLCGLKDSPYPGSEGAMTVKASFGSPPNRAGSVSRGIMSRNSKTEPGQPCINKSGYGFGPTPGACRKWRSMSC